MKPGEVDPVQYFIDRMRVHATLTARHLNLPPGEALPALVVAALILADNHKCTDIVTARIKDFLAQTNIVKKEELDKWR